MSNFKGNRALLYFCIKSLLSSVLSIIAFSAIFSLLILELDLDNIFYDVFGYAVVTFSSLITVLISTSSFKNNFLLMGMTAQLPILILIIVNTCYNGKVLQFVIKVCITIMSCIVITILKNKKKGRIKI